MNIQTISFLLISAYSYYFMNKVLKTTAKDCALTKSEKIQVIITLLLNTVISWGIYSFGWKKKLPTKSKQVDKYLKNIILSLIAIGVIGIVLAILLNALK